MSDGQDPLQDSLEPTPQEADYSASDRKIVFGIRKPTEDAVSLVVPLIIEAPFPYERTLHWHPASGPAVTPLPAEKKVESDAADQPDGELPLSPPDNGEAVAKQPATDLGYTAVVVSQEVLLKVNEHVSQSLDCELGGFLLGNRYRCPNSARDFVIIDQFSQAKFTESSEVNLAFTHEAWAQLADELSGKFLGKLLIGWYHSHPRMDVFLSSHDMEIQTERFPEPWMVALVLEPEKHRGGFFCSRDGRVKPNSPVDFFELLERNSRDSVLAWENYSAVDPATSAAPVMSATNTATPALTSSPELINVRALQKDGPAPKRRRKRLFLISMLVVLLLAGTAAGVTYRQRLSRWLQNKVASMRQTPPAGVVAPQPAAVEKAPGTDAPTPSPQPTVSPSPAPVDSTPASEPAANGSRKGRTAASTRSGNGGRRPVKPAPTPKRRNR